MTSEITRLSKADDTSLWGGKASRLSQLIGAGLCSLDGFVCRGDVPDYAVEKATKALVERIRVPQALFAVRSSGVAEDSADASYAGMFDTCLEVPAGDVPKAVKSVRESSLSRVKAYQAAKGVTDADTTIAVVVMEMADRHTSGVAFSINPVTYANEVIIEATWGLGDKLVGGEVTPERYVVRGGHVASEPATLTPMLNHDECLSIMAKVAQASQLLGGRAVDVEWCLHRRAGIQVVQVRPVVIDKGKAVKALASEVAEFRQTFAKRTARNLFDYFTLICGGEVRANHSGVDCPWHGTMPPGMIQYDPRTTLPRMGVMFKKLKFSGGWGGKNWANIAKCAGKWFELDGENHPVAFADHVVDLTHNAGPGHVFNKGSIFQHTSGSDGTKYVAMLDAKLHGSLLGWSEKLTVTREVGDFLARAISLGVIPGRSYKVVDDVEVQTVKWGSKEFTPGGPANVKESETGEESKATFPAAAGGQTFPPGTPSEDWPVNPQPGE